MHFSEFIPEILQREKDKLKEELKSVEEVLVIFDRTALLGEAFAIMVCFSQEEIFKPTQRLIHLEALAKVLKGDELAQRLISCLAVE